MTKVLLNAMSSTAGGGITYLKNVLPRLSELDETNSYVALVPAEHLDRYARFNKRRVAIISGPTTGGALKRLWWEQTGLRTFIKTENIDVLVSLGNFALLTSPIPQILFDRSDLYFSDCFARDLRNRGLYAELIIHRLKSALARASIKTADINLTPTKAFADRIRRAPGMGARDFTVLRFGFDRESFASQNAPLPSGVIEKINFDQGVARMLFVSHYNYFRNFETLIRALPAIKRRIGGRIQLVLTTDIKRGAVYGGYDASAASELIDSIGVRGDIAMLGEVPYESLHQLYRICDLFVCPSYSESFGHPLVEAMASGLPVASADLPVHREICKDAAVYFSVFDENELAAQCVRALTDEGLRKKMRERGLRRSEDFSWDEHVSRLIGIIDKAADRSAAGGLISDG